MLTIASPPPAMAGTRRPILVQFSTDQVTGPSGTVHGAVFQIDTAAAIDETWVFIFNGITVTLTAKAGPDSSGSQFTSGTTSGITLASDLQQNYFLSENFTISSPSANRVQLTAKAPGTAYNIDSTGSSWSGFSLVSETPGEDPATLENFQAWLDLYIEEPRGSNDFGNIPVAKLTATQGASGFFIFDLSAILDGYVGDDPPPQAAGVVLLTVLPVRKYKFRYNEAFGSPIEPRATSESGPYYCFQGRKEHEAAGTSNNSFSDTFLTGRPLVSNMWHGQSGYLYLRTDPALLTIAVTPFRDDGTAFPPYFLPVPSGARESVVKVPAGPAQLSVPAGTVRYDIYFEYGAGTSRTYTVNIIDQCPPHSTYLLFRNALGGYESLPVTGAKAKKGSFKADMHDRILPANYTQQTRESHTFNHQGDDTWDMHTGWVFTGQEADYYARQFMMSENILMPSGEGLVPMVLTSKEVTYSKDRIHLYGFSFALKKASPHRDRHTTHLI
ncbi:MAG: hypothetical protein AAFX78_14680 [Cyanobacteria bacterium J06638_20]